MPAPTMPFDHALDFLKGWPSQTALDTDAKLSSSVSATAKPVYGGRVVHKNNADEFELGAKLNQMPIFLIQGSEDFDVSNQGTDWVAIAPTGVMSGLVATGGFELQSTEFNDVAYNVNDFLHAPTEDQITGTDKSAAGKLYNTLAWPGGGGGAVAFPTHNICGVVSKVPALNHHRRKVISFWTVFFPGTAL